MHPAITGDDIREMRRGVGLSQLHLARRMHCSPRQIKRWEAESPFMPDAMAIIFLDVVMHAMAERDDLMQLRLVVHQKLLHGRTDFGLKDGPKPSSSVG